MVDVEVVQPPRRSVAAKVAGIHVVEPGTLEEPSQLLRVLRAHLLLDAVGAEALHRAAHVDACLIERVAERVAGVSADDEPPLLRHERAHVPDRAADDDVDPLQ